MRAERLLRLQLLLQTHGKLTTGDLARRLEVSARTVQRDLDALALAGVPVYASRGRHGGWALAGDYRTRLDGLTPAEAVTVFVGTTAHVLADLGLDTTAASAFTKLLAAVPAHARHHAQFARERIHVDHTNWQGSSDRTWLAVLRQGLWHTSLVRLRYRSRTLDVGPLGLVAKKDHWYLVALRPDDSAVPTAIRTYKVSRIESASLLDTTFDRPADFDLAEHWRASNEIYFSSLRTYPVRLRVHPDALPRLHWAPNSTVDTVTPGDPWPEVAMTFENALEARVYLLGLAGHLVVLHPPELRTAMLEAARTFVAAHT